MCLFWSKHKQDATCHTERRKIMRTEREADFNVWVSLKLFIVLYSLRFPNALNHKGNQERSGSNLSCSHRCMTPRPGIKESQEKYIYTTRIVLLYSEYCIHGEKQNDKNSSGGSAVIIIFVSLLISLDPNFYYYPYICYRARKTKISK
jgi:hypothetical protein